MSPSKPRPSTRTSITPDRDIHRRLSRLTNVFPHPQDIPKFNSPRPSLRRSLFPSPKRGSPSPVRRSSFISAADSPVRDRIFPSRPCHSLPLDSMQSDFYVSPLDWSHSNRIAFALTDEVVLINPKSMDLTTLPDTPDDVLSLKFSPASDTLFFGCDSGFCMLYDVEASEPVSELSAFDASVLSRDWKDATVAIGSRDGEVAIVDVRGGPAVVRRFDAHPEEICAIKHHPERPLFATCGNDCTVKIWDFRSVDANAPFRVYAEHEAAIRAVAWSPNAADLIVTGGGTADKRIRIWNVATGETLKVVDSGSQVCNLYWNAQYNEIISSHGYSQNHLALWRGIDLSPIASFHQHKERVLYMCVAPDGATVATAAANDSFQIWKMFPARQTAVTQSLLLLR